MQQLLTLLFLYGGASSGNKVRDWEAGAFGRGRFHLPPEIRSVSHGGDRNQELRVTSFIGPQAAVQPRHRADSQAPQVGWGDSSAPEVLASGIRIQSPGFRKRVWWQDL